jgi:hypothetical protein
MFKPMSVGRKLELPEFARASKGRAVASWAALAAMRVMRDRPNMLRERGRRRKEGGRDYGWTASRATGVNVQAHLAAISLHIYVCPVKRWLVGSSRRFYIRNKRGPPNFGVRKGFGDGGQVADDEHDEDGIFDQLLIEPSSRAKSLWSAKADHPKIRNRLLALIWTRMRDYGDEHLRPWPEKKFGRKVPVHVRFCPTDSSSKEQRQTSTS